MRYNEHYESWKRQRATVDVPGDFADRVMTSIHNPLQHGLLLLALLKFVAIAGRSKIFRAGICVLALRSAWCESGAYWRYHSLVIAKGDAAMTESVASERKPSIAVCSPC